MPAKHEVYNEAEKLKDQGKLAEAVAKLQEALAIDPNYALAHAALAVIHTKLGEHEKAIQHGLKVVEIEPNDPFSYTAMSVTYQRAGRIPEAEMMRDRAHMAAQRR
jgi:Tfp pilus assembly protein PilF